MIVEFLLLAHILGDFIFQSGSLAKNKQNNLPALLKHAIIYTLFMTMIFWLSPTLSCAITAFVLSAVHLLVDFIGSTFLKKRTAKKELIIFLGDQFIHVVLIILIYFLFVRQKDAYAGLLSWGINSFGYDKVKKITAMILAFSICLTPTAVFVRKLFDFLFGKREETSSVDKNRDSSQDNIGAVIGGLERTILLTLGLLGQIGAIGLVIAAKSLARFSQLNDKDFAEKYLVGTLTSAVIALFCMLIVMKFY